MLNPCEEFVENLKRRVKQNNGFCIYADDRNKKSSKCTKWCGKDPDKCMCGMYVDINIEPTEYDLD